MQLPSVDPDGNQWQWNEINIAKARRAWRPKGWTRVGLLRRSGKPLPAGRGSEECYKLPQWGLGFARTPRVFGV